MPSERSEIPLEFRGTALQALGWIAASIAGTVSIVPLAWVYAAIARWICRNTVFGDGTTAEFRGTGGDIVVWTIFLVLVSCGQLIFIDPDSYASIAVVLSLSYFLTVAIILTLLKWFVHNLRLSSGPQLVFTGSFLGLLGWYVLIAVSAVTLIGWAWAAAAMHRWIASHVKGQGIAVEFRAAGLELLWRSLAVALGSILIVTIPWLAVWLFRWLIQNIVLIRGVETSWGSFIEKKKTPPKPSSPSEPSVWPIG